MKPKVNARRVLDQCDEVERGLLPVDECQCCQSQVRCIVAQPSFISKDASSSAFTAWTMEPPPCNYEVWSR